MSDTERDCEADLAQLQHTNNTLVLLIVVHTVLAAVIFPQVLIVPLTTLIASIFGTLCIHHRQVGH